MLYFHAYKGTTCIFVLLFLCDILLCSTWIGLNVVRFYSYDPISVVGVYSTVICMQEFIQKLLALSLIPIGGLGMYTLVHTCYSWLRRGA